MNFLKRWGILLAFAATGAAFAAFALSRSSGRRLQLEGQHPTSSPGEGKVITAASFGFQCGTALPSNCPNEAWPKTVAQPGMIRLWGSQVQWHSLNTGPGTYNWKILDGYLDVIAAHQPRETMYTFGFTPCWDTKGNCERGWGSVSPPSDLTSKGSPSFNTFVNALVDHCSPSGHCVKSTIKYWEMWNEANGPGFWSGTTGQLYDLMAPGIEIIRRKVPGALVLTPPPNRDDTDWMRGWLDEEYKRGKLSDIFSFHLYLQDQRPEIRFQDIRDMVDLKTSTAGWRDMPWMNTETNFHAAHFDCSTRFSREECTGQMVRWHLLQFAYGAENVNWYFFNTTIGRNPDLDQAYHRMMEWLVGGHFTGQCAPAGSSAKGTIVSCPFLQASGHHAVFVWNFGGDNVYAAHEPYTDYKKLNGETAALPANNQIPIDSQPIMLESAH